MQIRKISYDYQDKSVMIVCHNLTPFKYEKVIEMAIESALTFGKKARVVKVAINDQTKKPESWHGLTMKLPLVSAKDVKIHYNDAMEVRGWL